jgi:translation elongation factor EF-G
MNVTTTTLTLKNTVTCIGNVKGMDGYPGQYAIVSLNVRPVDGEDQSILIVDDNATVVNQSGEDYNRNEVGYFLEGIRKGIYDVIMHYQKLGVGISGLEVVVDKLVVHPIDSTEGAFRAAARNAMASCLVIGS